MPAHTYAGAGLHGVGAKGGARKAGQREGHGEQLVYRCRPHEATTEVRCSQPAPPAGPSPQCPPGP